MAHIVDQHRHYRITEVHREDLRVQVPPTERVDALPQADLDEYDTEAVELVRAVVFVHRSGRHERQLVYDFDGNLDALISLLVVLGKYLGLVTTEICYRVP